MGPWWNVIDHLRAIVGGIADEGNGINKPTIMGKQDVDIGATRRRVGGIGNVPGDSGGLSFCPGKGGVLWCYRKGPMPATVVTVMFSFISTSCYRMVIPGSNLNWAFLAEGKTSHVFCSVLPCQRRFVKFGK